MGICLIFAFGCGVEDEENVDVDQRGNTVGNIANSGYVTQQGDWIYYVNQDDDDKIYKIRTDGRGREKVNDDDSRSLNVAGGWIYYFAFIGDGNQFKVRIDSTERQLLEENAEQYGEKTIDFSGGTYVGELRGGLPHGQGIWVEPSGYEYVGEFKDGMMHGQATWTDLSENKYVGEYKDSMKHGQGTYTYADGPVESGIWENDELVKPH